MTGREGLSGEETIRPGTYNALLQNSLPKEFQYYKADEESFESSHDVFRSAFPRGFAWEVISVYSGPPEIAFKFRHWGYFEGPFKGRAHTGEVVQFYGLATLKVFFTYWPNQKFKFYFLTRVSEFFKFMIIPTYIYVVLHFTYTK